MTTSTPSSTAPPILELRDVEASYGPFRSLFGVSFSIAERSVMALLGGNGSGKTTVLRVCSGLLKPTTGSLLYDGDDITGRRAYRLARLGILHAPEGRSVFASLTVEENLVLTFRQVFGRRGTQGALDKAYTLFPRLGDRRRQLAGTLSGGEQRMLSLGRVLVREPRLLITDELSLGLAPVIVKRLVPAIQAVAESGIGVLLIEQFAHVALGLAKTAYVLEAGRIRYHGTAQKLKDEPELLHSAYLLRERAGS
jgi:branched-chain amino acid transport system ATP-binding protein